VVINTASVQFIPFTVIGLLANYGSSNPNKIFLPTFLTTTIHATSAVIILYIFKRFYDRGR
jgi:spore maturation protein A